MKVLLVNYSDVGGGAASFSRRLLKGLLNLDVDTTLYVCKKKSNLDRVIDGGNFARKVFSFIDAAPNIFYPNRKKLPFSSGLVGGSLKEVIHKINPDIVHLNWINGGFLSFKEISKINKPIVWTLHDSWFFTGGCHLPLDCRRYAIGCGKCPMLGSKSKDVSNIIFKLKYNAWISKNMDLVCPSNWLKNNLSKSPLSNNKKITVIHNGLDIDYFSPNQDREIIKGKYGIISKKIILYGATNILSDINKGFDLLEKIYSLIPTKKRKEFQFVAFGSKEVERKSDLIKNTLFLGNINDESKLKEIYSMADIFLMTSKSENLPYTVMEAMSCGTPVLGFDVGGLADLVTVETGCLIKNFDIKMYVNKMIEMLDSKIYEGMRKKNREIIVNNFDIKFIAKQYITLYSSVLKK